MKNHFMELTMELVGDTEFVIELFMVVDVVVKLLFVMEVKIAWLSSALETLLPLVTDVNNPWVWCCDVTTLLLLLVLLFWMLLCRTAPFSALDCCWMKENIQSKINKNSQYQRNEANMKSICTCCDEFITDDAWCVAVWFEWLVAVEIAVDANAE